MQLQLATLVPCTTEPEAYEWLLPSPQDEAGSDNNDNNSSNDSSNQSPFNARLLQPPYVDAEDANLEAEVVYLLQHGQIELHENELTERIRLR